MEDEEEEGEEEAELVVTSFVQCLQMHNNHNNTEQPYIMSVCNDLFHNVHPQSAPLG